MKNEAKILSRFPHLRFSVSPFTNKAAGEIWERIGKLLGGPPAGITIATFHGLCSSLLRVPSRVISRSHRFSIYDDEDASREIRETAKELGAEGAWEEIWSDIDRLKNHGALPEEDLISSLGRRDPEGRMLPLLREAYSLYEEKLARYDALDFNDLLFKAILLFTRHPEILSHLRRRCRHLLVDEYQDTAPLQERLRQLLSAPGYNLCALGDDGDLRLPPCRRLRHSYFRGPLSRRQGDPDGGELPFHRSDHRGRPVRDRLKPEASAEVDPHPESVGPARSRRPAFLRRKKRRSGFARKSGVECIGDRFRGDGASLPGRLSFPPFGEGACQKPDSLRSSRWLRLLGAPGDQGHRVVSSVHPQSRGLP